MSGLFSSLSRKSLPFGLFCETGIILALSTEKTDEFLRNLHNFNFTITKAAMDNMTNMITKPTITPKNGKISRRL